MGLFDSVYADCPRCGKAVEFQSKADDDPYMNCYTLDDAPAHILIDVLNDPHYCNGCETWFALVDPRFPPGDEMPRPNPRALPVRQPQDGEARLYEGDRSFGWWEAKFTFADLAQGIEAGTAETEGLGSREPGPKDAP